MDLKDPLRAFPSGRSVLAANHKLARALTKGLPIVAAIDGFNAKTAGQEEQLQLAREEDVHIQPGQVALMLARLEELFVGPGDMLQLLESIVFAAAVEQHRKLAGRVDLVLQVDMRGPIQR